MITEVKGSVEKEQKVKANRRAYCAKEIEKMTVKSAGFQEEIDAIDAWEGKVAPELSKVMSVSTPFASVSMKKKPVARKK